MSTRITPLRPGTVAPDIRLPRTPQEHLNLRSLLGDPIVLVFYPMDWEPVSREQLVLYQSYCREFAHFRAHLVGISVDHAASHAAFARDAQIRFPLLADFQPRGAVADRYGVYRMQQGVSARALFVVGPPGIIGFSAVYPDALNPGVNNILTTLEAMAAANTHGR
ncbi:MAG: redoxin domain-containing protein [Ktedonobacterales bacterium]